jgi:hypothetical protein
MIVTFPFFKDTEFPFKPYKFKFFINSAQPVFETFKFLKVALDMCTIRVTALGATAIAVVIDSY